MPKLRRLTGSEVVAILGKFGFEGVRIKGSHHIVERVVEYVDESGVKQEIQQTLTIPVHGHKQIPLGTLRKIYRDACRYIDEAELKPHFYGQ